MIIVIISHFRVPGSSSSGNRSEQFEAIPALKDFVRVADLQRCNVLSTTLIRSEIFCFLEINFQRLHSRDNIFYKVVEDLVKIKFIM